MRVAILEPLGISSNEIANIAGDVLPFEHELVQASDRVEVAEVLIERAEGAEAVIIANVPFPDECIDALPDIKILSVAFTGIDHVGMTACKARGIAVCNAAGYSTTSVAEHAVGLTLAVYRHIPKADAAARAGKTRTGLLGQDLCGKTVGIIGTGAIGQHTAKLFVAFGCRALGWSRSKRGEFADLGGEYVELDELLSESDVVTLHIPLTDETRGLIGRQELFKMKPGTVLINCARGPIVDNQALADSLARRHLFGAGIDVFETEPPLDTDHSLLKSPYTVVAPHVAFATTEAMRRRAHLVFENIAAWKEGKPVRVCEG